MKNHIEIWSYWLGLASAVIALVMRTFNAFGFWLPGKIMQGTTIWYMSFYKAALLFFLINIATALGGWSHVLRTLNSRVLRGDQSAAADQPAPKVRTAGAGL